MITRLKLQTASLRGKIKSRGQMDPLFINLCCLITFSRLLRCYFFTLPGSNIRILLPFFTGMKTFQIVFLHSRNFPSDIGLCKYDNIAVLNLYLETKKDMLCDLATFGLPAA